MTHRLVSLLSLALMLAACGGGDGGDDDGSNDDSQGDTNDTPTGGAQEIADVCASACAKFAECLGENPSCESDCVAGVEFIAMNNPNTQCGSYELGRQNCLAGLTCEQIDQYLESPDDPMRPCKSWVDDESECAIE